MTRAGGRVAFVLAALGIGALGLYLLPTWLDGVRDTHTWYWAGETIQEPEASIYRLTPGVAPFLGSPVFAAAWAPLTYLGRAVALPLWLVTVWCSVLVAALLILRLAGRGWWMLVLLLFIPLLLANGQVDAIVVALVGGAALALGSGRDAEAGILVAAAAHTKVYPFALIPVLWMMGRRRASMWALGAFVVAGVVAPAVWAGIAEVPELYVEQLRVLAGTGPVGHSLQALLPGPLVRLLGLTMYGLVLLDARRTDDALRPLALGLSAVMLTSPLIWGHSFLIMALPLADLVRRRPRWGLAASGVLGVVGVIFYFPMIARIVWTLTSIAIWWVALLVEGPPWRGRPATADAGTEAHATPLPC